MRQLEKTLQSLPSREVETVAVNVLLKSACIIWWQREYIDCFSNTLIDKTWDSDVRNPQKRDTFLQFFRSVDLFPF